METELYRRTKVRTPEIVYYFKIRSVILVTDLMSNANLLCWLYRHPIDKPVDPAELVLIILIAAHEVEFFDPVVIGPED